MGRQKQAYDLGLVEKLAAQIDPKTLTPLTQRQIAGQMGITQSAFQMRLTQRSDVRAAFDRGRARAGKGEAADALTAETAPAVAPDPPLPAGLTREQLVVEVIRRGARTFGKLRAVTRLDYDELVIVIQRLMQRSIVFARCVNDERWHFVAGEQVNCELCGALEGTRHLPGCG